MILLKRHLVFVTIWSAGRSLALVPICTYRTSVTPIWIPTRIFRTRMTAKTRHPILSWAITISPSSNTKSTHPHWNESYSDVYHNSVHCVLPCYFSFGLVPLRIYRFFFLRMSPFDPRRLRKTTHPSFSACVSCLLGHGCIKSRSAHLLPSDRSAVFFPSPASLSFGKSF